MDQTNPYFTSAIGSLRRAGIPDVPDIDPQSVAVLAFDSAWLSQGTACIQTIRRMGPASLDIVVLGMGLSARERASLEKFGVKCRPLPATVPLAKGGPAHARAMTCRPFLREIVPGYNVYFWVDSDIRVLRPDAIPFYLRCALLPERPVVIAAEFDLAYFVYRSPLHWLRFQRERRERVERLFGSAAAEVVEHYYQFNAGLWAMHRESPIWDLYRAHVEHACTQPYDRLAEQDAMNLAILQSGMCVWPAPATHNWICSMGHPLFNTGSREWLRPMYPYVPLAVAHLTDQHGPVIWNGEEMTNGELYSQSGLLTPA
jgi:hypothetical protein